MRIPIATHSYRARALPLSAQRLVNLYPEAAPPDARAPVVLYGTPGLVPFAACGSGPVRGMHVFLGGLCVVSGDTLTTVDPAGAATERGFVGGSGPVSMADNGHQLMIVAGPGPADAFVWDGATLSPITDPAYPGADTVAFIDGYHVVNRPGTGEFWWSNLRDCTRWDGGDYATAEGSPDPLIGVIADHREVWLFGRRTTEIWYPSGAPFDRISGAFLERGCAARGSIAKADNSVFWLGDDLIVYRAAGYAPQRISTHAIEYAIAGYAEPSAARAFTYADEGHTFYVLGFDAATFVYDAATGLWHERESRDPATGVSMGRWRAECGIGCYGKTLVGDCTGGAVRALDLDAYTEAGTAIRRLATSAPIHAGGKRVVMSRLEVEVESGAGLAAGQGADPQAMLQWSDDGGKTWSHERWASMGAIGAFSRRVTWTRPKTVQNRFFIRGGILKL